MVVAIHRFAHFRLVAEAIATGSGPTAVLEVYTQESHHKLERVYGETLATRSDSVGLRKIRNLLLTQEMNHVS